MIAGHAAVETILTAMRTFRCYVPTQVIGCCVLARFAEAGHHEGAAGLGRWCLHRSHAHTPPPRRAAAWRPNCARAPHSTPQPQGASHHSTLCKLCVGPSHPRDNEIQSLGRADQVPLLYRGAGLQYLV